MTKFLFVVFITVMPVITTAFAQDDNFKPANSKQIFLNDADYSTVDEEIHLRSININPKKKINRYSACSFIIATRSRTLLS